MRKHNRHLLRHLGAFLMAAAMMLGIAACGQAKPFDASGYVNATMKSLTTQDSSALNAYSGTAVTDLADTVTKKVEDAMGDLSGVKLSPDLQKKCKVLINSMLKAISYSVGAAKESGAGSDTAYQVPVTIKPLQLNIQSKLKDWSGKLDTEGTSGGDLTAVYEKLYKEIASLLQEEVAAAEYGQAKTYIINVTKNEKGLYTINQDDLKRALEGAYSTDLKPLT